MDPLSITMSIIGLVGVVRKTLRTSKAFRHAPDQLDSLLNDLTDAQLLLTDVELSLQEDSQRESLPTRLRTQVCSRLEDAKQQLSELLQLTERFTSDDASRDFRRKAQWVVAKGKIERFKGKLEAICESLREALGEYKRGCIDLELQNISLTLSNASSERSDLSDEMSEIVREQKDGFRESSNNQVQILSKLSNLENYMHTEGLPSSTDGRNQKSDTSDDYGRRYQRVAVRASQRKAMCDSDTCTCQCHRPTPVQDQTALRKVLAGIFAGYSGQPATFQKCTNRFCQRITHTSTVTYYFPRWWFAQRMLGLVVDMTVRSSTTSLPAPPRIVPAPARIFRHAAGGQTDVLRDMFAAGLGSPNDTDAETGVTPLHYACDQLQERTVKYLLSRGADRTQKSFEGLSAVAEAWGRLLTNSVPKEKRSILEAICDEEDLDEFEFTDLHRAVVKLSPTTVKEEILRLLRSTQATIDDLDAQGRSAVSWAAQCGDFDALRTLLEHGASTESPRGTKTPLHFAAGMTKSTACVSILLEHGADPHTPDVAGMTGLMWSCVNFQRHFASVKTLIPVSDLESKDINGRTAIFHAASTHLTPTKALIEAGADINHADKEGFTALHMSISYNHPDIFLALHAFGADHLVVRGNGQNILHHAASYANSETLSAMMFAQLRGAEVNSQDADKCTPRDRFHLRIPQPTPEVESAFDRLLEHILSLRPLRPWRTVSGESLSPSSSTPVTWKTASENGKNVDTAGASATSSPAQSTTGVDDHYAGQEIEQDLAEAIENQALVINVTQDRATTNSFP